MYVDHPDLAKVILSSLTTGNILAQVKKHEMRSTDFVEFHSLEFRIH